MLLLYSLVLVLATLNRKELLLHFSKYENLLRMIFFSHNQVACSVYSDEGSALSSNAQYRGAFHIVFTPPHNDRPGAFSCVTHASTNSKSKVLDTNGNESTLALLNEELHTHTKEMTQGGYIGMIY